MDALELVNIIRPEHDRTSCDDKNLNNGFYSNSGFTRCARCTLLQIIGTGNMPKSHSLDLMSFKIDNKMAAGEKRMEVR